MTVALFNIRYAEAGKGKIRDQVYEDARLCKSFVGSDAFSQYLSCASLCI